MGDCANPAHPELDRRAGQPDLIPSLLSPAQGHGREDDAGKIRRPISGVYERNGRHSPKAINPELKSTWFNRLPKVELHLHLEGAIPLDALWELVQKYGGEVKNRQELAQQFEYKDFPHFIETWMWKNQFLREYDDFTFIAERTARDLAGQSIRYAEVFYSPPDFIQNGLQTQQITEAIRKGLDRVKDIEIALVADLVRNYGPKRAMTTLEQVSEVKQLGVIGVGIGGSEHDFPPGPFKEVYALSAPKGLSHQCSCR